MGEAHVYAIEMCTLCGAPTNVAPIVTHVKLPVLRVQPVHGNISPEVDSGWLDGSGGGRSTVAHLLLPDFCRQYSGVASLPRTSLSP